MLDLFLNSKSEKFFWAEIHKLPERWEKVIAGDGKYFEWIILHHFIEIIAFTPPKNSLKLMHRPNKNNKH